jgi:hypothetical protein
MRARVVERRALREIEGDVHGDEVSRTSRLAGNAGARRGLCVGCVARRR